MSDGTFHWPLHHLTKHLHHVTKQLYSLQPLLCCYQCLANLQSSKQDLYPIQAHFDEYNLQMI